MHLMFHTEIAVIPVICNIVGTKHEILIENDIMNIKNL